MANQTHKIVTSEDVLKHSYYTLCRLVDATRYANPIAALPVAIARGDYVGELVTDELGNFVSFK